MPLRNPLGWSILPHFSNNLIGIMTSYSPYFIYSESTHTLYHAHCTGPVPLPALTNGLQTMKEFLIWTFEMQRISTSLEQSTKMLKNYLFSLNYNWNSLPLDRQHPNRVTFKIFLKQHFWDDGANLIQWQCPPHTHLSNPILNFEIFTCGHLPVPF
jgi:hypothetical protein